MRIFDFAKVASWDDRLADLAGMAEPERWQNLHLPSNDKLPILSRYVTYTFLRAYDQQKIIFGENIACFNTGLLTSGHEEIYGVFTESENYDNLQPESNQNERWFLKSWARSGDRALTDIMEFPPMAEYWTDPSHLIYDPKLQVQLNLDHIVRDNLNRFPEELGAEWIARESRPIC